MDSIDYFRRCAQDIGLIIDNIISDAKMHRVPVKNKENRKDGAYLLRPNGWFWMTNWCTGEIRRGSSPEVNNSSEANKNYLDEVKKELKKMYDTARKKAQSICKDAKPSSDEHPYLKKKGVHTHPNLKIGNKGELLVPVYNKEDELVGVQMIYDNGDKRFLKGSRTKGCFHIFEAKDSDRIVICEGIATGLSIFQCTQYTVVTAFTAGNLTSVAKIMSARYPDKQIIIAADYDKPSQNCPEPGGVGVLQAKDAAIAISASIAIPHMDNIEKLDFNDLHVKMGEETVAKQIDSCTKIDSASERFQKNYVNRPTGLYYISDPNNNDSKEIHICSNIYILGETHDDKNENWGLLIRIIDRENKSHEFILPQSLICKSNQDVISELTSRGLCLTCVKSKSYLYDYLIGARSPHKIRTITKTGWCDGAYILPNKTISKDNSEKIVFQSSLSIDSFQYKGKFKSWHDNIGNFLKGNSMMIFSVSAALASCLLSLTGTQSVGFNTYGTTSTGKTTVMNILASSIWGKATLTNGYSYTWRSTCNGLESIAALHNDALLCLDELAEVSPQDLNNAIYLLMNGTGKIRSTVTGDLATVRSWTTLLLSTGEMTINDKLAQDKIRIKGGQGVRFIDLPSNIHSEYGIFEDIYDFNDSKSFADYLRDNCSKNYGTPIRKFLKKLIEDMDSNIEKAKKWLKIFSDKLSGEHTEPEILRVAKSFAICAVAGELAIEFEIFPLERKDSLHAIELCFKRWLENRKENEEFGPKQYANILYEFIHRHSSSRFQDLLSESGNKLLIRDKAGFKKFCNNKTVYYIPKEIFRNEIFKGFNHKLVAKALYDQKLLKRDKDGFTVKPDTELPEIGYKRVYIVTIPLEPKDEKGNEKK